METDTGPTTLDLPDGFDGAPLSSPPMSHMHCFAANMVPFFGNNSKATPTDRGGTSRVPETFQAVFLSSNRGKQVDNPPPESVASKNFGFPLFRRRAREHRKAGWRGSKRSEVKFPIAEISIPTVDTCSLPLHSYLHEKLHRRGYSVQTYDTLETGYSNKATELQIASYSLSLIKMVKENDSEKLSAHLAAGLSPNACNEYGESLLHLICRHGQVASLRVVLEHGARVQICDDFGRVPLHDACWTASPCFEVVDLLLAKEPRLFFMKDRRGALPLSYVPQQNTPQWQAYLDSRLAKYWPERNSLVLGDEPGPIFTDLKPNSNPVSEPALALPVYIVTMLGQGKISANEAQKLRNQTEDDFAADIEEREEGALDEDIDDDASSSSSSLDEEEWREIIQSIGSPVVNLSW